MLRTEHQLVFSFMTMRLKVKMIVMKGEMIGFSDNGESEMGSYRVGSSY